MIIISGLKQSDIGRWVEYYNGFTKEQGRIKSWNDKFIFVVYKCADEWNNFENYTAAATGPQYLKFIKKGDMSETEH